MAEPGEESRFRRYKGVAHLWQDISLILVPVTGIISILNLPLHVGLSFYIQQYLAIFFSLVLSLVFLLVPAQKKMAMDTLPWYDSILAVLSLIVGFYAAIFYKDIVVELGLLIPHRILLGTVVILLILEATRRLIGWPFLIIVICFIFYALFASFFPGGLYATAISWPRLANYLYLDPQGILGIAIEVAATVVFAFVIFGQTLFRTGGGQFFIDAALSIMGRYRGGPAKVSVISSSLFGTVSGSAVANVMVDGWFTIPLMKANGFKDYTASAIEAVASTGGQIMPPVMGAAAFMMATFLGIPYAKVALSAALPAILYYIAVYIQIDLIAIRNGLHGLPRESLPSFKEVMKKGGYSFFISILFLIYLLFIANLDGDKAGLYAAASVLIISFFKKETRPNIAKLISILKDTGEGMLEIGVISAGAGLIIGIISITGLGYTFSSTLISLSGGSTFLLLVLAAAGAVVLGMGMTVTAAYLLMVILIAPALTTTGVAPLNAHLFVFYFAVMSFVTPPVCLAVYAAASIGKADMFKTGYQAIRLSIAAYIVPFIFVYHPALLLQGNVIDVLVAVVTAVIGISLVAIAVEGYLFRPLDWVRRILLCGGGILSLIPGWETDLLGLAIALPIVFWEWKKNRK
ncbi:MAG: TRAP transporter fused permease subunit [Desulfobacterales bacterium]|nr:TRAP transporter fused permease subunit [Desulfobacterales bacterium]